MTGARYPDLEGKAVFVTGGATGIGAAFVEAFAEQGAKVAFFDIDEGEGDALADCMNEGGREALFVPCDLSDMDALRQAFDEASEELDAADILISNAANDARHDFQSLSPETWDELTAINLKHQYFAAQAVAPGMTADGGGTIVNLSSNTFLLGLPGYPAYAAAKAGVYGLTKALARELGPSNIRVNAIAPGWVMTDKQKRLWLTDEAEAELMEAQALKTQIEPDDVANLAVFLASDAARMITGGLHLVDGGRW